MSYMFSGCSKLTELDLTKWQTDSLAQTNKMFENCYGLEELDMSNFMVKGQFVGMFEKCSGIAELDLSKFEYNLSHCCDEPENIFDLCISLEVIHIPYVPEGTYVENAVPVYFELPEGTWVDSEGNEYTYLPEGVEAGTVLTKIK